MLATTDTRNGMDKSHSPHGSDQPLLMAIALVMTLYIAYILATMAGWTGFVRGGPLTAAVGVACAIADGVMFTLLLIYCQRLNKAGVGPGAVFGLRFPLYVLVVGGVAFAGFDQRPPLAASDIAFIVAIGLALTIPPLYALQRAVAVVSTMTISVLSALGPFVIFDPHLIHRD